MKKIKIWFGTCRHPQDVPVSHVAEISDDGGEFVSLKLKPRRWVQDTFGDRQWHGWVVAERPDLCGVLVNRHTRG